MTRKWKIINSLIAWLILFSLVQPAYGAWDTLTVEVTFTAQTGVWNTDPTPTPAAEPAAASVTSQPASSPEAPADIQQAPTATPDTAEHEETTVTPTPAPTPETPAEPTPESPEIPTPQENSEAE